MKEPTQIDWARLAAFIDGEGCIEIVKSSTTIRGKKYFGYTFRIEVFNTDPRLPAWCERTFGGKAYKRQRQRKHWRPCFGWRVNSGKAIFILRGCKEFFILKREQVEIAEAFLATIGKHGADVSDEVNELRRYYKNQLNIEKKVSREFVPSTTVN